MILFIEHNIAWTKVFYLTLLLAQRFPQSLSGLFVDKPIRFTLEKFQLCQQIVLLFLWAIKVKTLQINNRTFVRIKIK